MKYTKVKVASADAPNRLYRVMYLRDDMNLVHFAAVIKGSFQAFDSHLYEFVSQGRHYGLYPEISEDQQNYPMMDYRVSDLENKCRFIYDLGEKWEFNITIFRNPADLRNEERVIVVEARGAGIFEDGRNTFLHYIHGDIDPASSNVDPERGFTLPENLSIDTFGEFDDPVDLYELEEMIDDELPEEMSSEWLRFDAYMNAASEQWDDGEPCTLYSKAFEEFRKVCKRKREAGVLAMDLEKLLLEPGVPSSVRDLIFDLPLAFIETGDWEELHRILKEMPDVIELNGDLESQWKHFYCDSLIHLGRMNEAEKMINAWYEELPMNEWACMAKAKQLCDQNDIKGAEQVYDRYISQCEEPDFSSGILLQAAEDFYKNNDMHEKARTCREKLEELHRWMEEYWFDPDEADAESMERIAENGIPPEISSFQGNVLEHCCDQFRIYPNQRNFVRIFLALAELMVRNEKVTPHIHSVGEEGIEFVTAQGDDGNPYLILYSGPFACRAASFEPEMKLTMRQLYTAMQDLGTEGILIDPLPEQSPIIIPAHLLSRFLDMLLDEEYDSPAEVPSMLS